VAKRFLLLFRQHVVLAGRSLRKSLLARIFGLQGPQCNFIAAGAEFFKPMLFESLEFIGSHFFHLNHWPVGII
jgi:hypothetical protein